MQGQGGRRVDPDLKQIVRGASRALALLDIERLEELARSCQILNQVDLAPADAARQAREAAGDMALFAQVLDATRANLDVMSRLRGLRQGTLSYADASSRPSPWMLSETGHGND